MTTRSVPADGQKGDLLGVTRVPVATARPAVAMASGVNAHGYLRRTILDEVFAEVVVASGMDALLTALPPGSAAVVVDHRERQAAVPWPTFLRWLGPRRAVVDVRVAAAMAQADGCALQVVTETGDRRGAVEVFRSHMACQVYPRAPRVQVVADTAIRYGFGAGDEFHLDAPERDVLQLAALRRDAALDVFVRAHAVQAWGLTAAGGHAALLTVPTGNGGHVTVMDLRAVDRAPEPSGVETLASQILLAALGVSELRFGKFVTAAASYNTFMDAVRTVAGTAAGTRLDRIGTSVGGQPLWLLKAAPNPQAPVVLFSCCVHPLEWAPAYGVLRYWHDLLRAFAAGDDQARRLLAACQLWWLPSVCPDGWETREQQPSGINLLRNFPGSWERCVPGETYYDGYNRRFAPAESEPFVARGPAPGSQPETQAVMRVLDTPGVRWAAYADFHETTAFDSFLHPHEAADGSVADSAYHRDLAAAVARAFAKRFYAHGNALARRPALADFGTYSFRALRSLERPVPNPLSGTIAYAQAKGIRACIAECAGCDCTHYQTVRRTEYAALVAARVTRLATAAEA